LHGEKSTKESLNSSYIDGNFIFPAMIEKVGNGIDVEGSGDRDRHE
jgi:hypothetical protein